MFIQSAVFIVTGLILLYFVHLCVISCSRGLEGRQRGAAEILPLHYQELDHRRAPEDPRGGRERRRPQPARRPAGGRPGEGGRR